MASRAQTKPGRRGARVISEEALTGCRQILTDERLEYMGDRYCRLGIGYWTGVSFYAYLVQPEVLEAEADRKRRPTVIRMRSHWGKSSVTREAERAVMDKEGLIYIGEGFMALNELINRYAPPDATEVQMGRHYLKMSYAFIRRAFGGPEDRKSEG